MNHYQKLGVLLTNIGTPEQCTVQGVRRYLRAFLSEPRVIKLPTLLRKLILEAFILPTRPEKSLKAYQKIWTSEGSPLLVTMQAIQAKLQEKLGEQAVITLGMNYSAPWLADGLSYLIDQQQCSRVLVLPLYPQYSASTAASTFDLIAANFKKREYIPSLVFIHQYYQHPLFLKAVADKIRRQWDPSWHLLFSFHGIPKSYVKDGDPYPCFCEDTAIKLTQLLQLEDQQWSFSFQSRLGPREWLRPYTDETLSEMPKRGIKKVMVVCPGFSVDCLETLEEIAILNREIFLDAGGLEYSYVPSLNSDEAQINLLAKLVEEAFERS